MTKSPNTRNVLPLSTPKADKNSIVKIPVYPERPVPEPQAIIKSDGRPFKYPIIVASPNAYENPWQRHAIVHQ
jgi:hypothetical protein